MMTSSSAGAGSVATLTTVSKIDRVKEMDTEVHRQISRDAGKAEEEYEACLTKNTRSQS